MTKGRKSKNNKSKKSQNTRGQQVRTKIVYKDKPMSVGAMLGDGLQKFGTSVIQRILGRGDYRMGDQMAMIKKNSLFKGANNQPPSFSKTGMSTFVFEHSEYITDIVSNSTAGAYKADVFNVSPSDPICFPWLSSLADSFQQYEIEGMIFRYESNSGDSVAGSNTALGTVMGLLSYDYSDPAPTSKTTFLQYDGCVDAKPSENFLVGVECAPDSNVFNKQFLGVPPTGTDPRMHYKGKFIIASSGVPGTAVTLGELWVHYRIRLSIASLPNINSVGGQIDGASAYNGQACISTSPYGFSFGLFRSTTLTMLPTTNSTMQIQGCIPGQVYIFYLSWRGPTAGTNTIAAPSLGGCTPVNAFENGASFQTNSSGVTNSAVTWLNFAVRATFSNISVTNTVNLGSGTPTNLAMQIFQEDATITL